MFKRCMGTPGDIIRIAYGRITINNRVFPEPEKVLLYTRLLSSNMENTFGVLDDMGFRSQLPLNRLSRDNEYLNFHLTIKEMGKISLLPEVIQLSIGKNRPDTAWRFYPRHDMYPWTNDDYIPLVIPREGMVIPLNHENLTLYRWLINGHEKAGIKAGSVNFTKDWQIMKEYTFRHDYYFMLGDNRHDSRDSRYFGPVPENMVICRTGRVLFSSKKNRNGSLRVMIKLR